MIHRGVGAAKIAEDGVFIIRFPGESFHNSAYYKGIMQRPVGLTKRYSHKHGIDGFDIPCLEEVEPEVDNPRSIDELMRDSDLGYLAAASYIALLSRLLLTHCLLFSDALSGWSESRRERNVDMFFDRIMSSEHLRYQQYSSESIRDLGDVFNLNSFKCPLYYWKRGSSTEDNSVMM